MPKSSWSVTTAFAFSFDHEKLFTQRWVNTRHPSRSLVFVHGLAGDHAAYQKVIENLLLSFSDLECITFDLRGHGQSSFIFSDKVATLVDQYAQDLTAICQFYSLKHPILVGQSYAGMVIQRYLELKQLPLPSHVILISSGLSMPSFGLSPAWCYQQLVNVSRHRNWPIRTRQWRDHQRHQGSWDFSPRRILTDIYFTHPLKYGFIWLAALGWEAHQPYVANEQTTGYIYGKKDVVIPVFWQRLFLRELPRVESVLINSNHNAIVNNPDLIAKKIIELIKQYS